MGLAILILGLVVFLGAHVFVSARGKRAAAIAVLGRLYWAVFGLISAVGLALIIWGFSLYRRYEWIDVWSPPAFMRHVTVGLMLLSVILVVAAYLPGHIKRWTKQPLLTGIKIWAFAHLLCNGDLGSILLFGSFLGWAVFARIAVKRRKDVQPPSVKPGWGNDALAVGLGIFIYLALGYSFHPVFVGVPVFGS